MSPKPYSLAVEEIKEEAERLHEEFEPQLKVIINKRWNKDSDSITAATPVTIRGRITVSF